VAQGLHINRDMNATQTKKVEKAIKKIKAECPDLPIRARAWSEYDDGEDADSDVWYVSIAAISGIGTDMPLPLAAITLRVRNEDDALAMAAGANID